MSNKYNVIHPIFNDYSANMVKTVFHQLGFFKSKKCQHKLSAMKVSESK